MSAYIKGRRAEYYVANIFKKAGFDISRSASSKGIWDFTALKTTEKNTYRVDVLVVCQVKVRKR